MLDGVAGCVSRARLFPTFREILPNFMVKLQRLFIAGTFVCLASVSVAKAQSATPTISELPSAQLGGAGSPKSGVSIQNNVPDSGQVSLSPQQTPRDKRSMKEQKHAIPGSGPAGSQSHSSADSGGSQMSMRLCFQPGVGWQNLPVSSVAGLRPPKAMQRQAFGAKNTMSNECPGVWPSAPEPGGVSGGPPTGGQSQSENALRATSTNAGAQDWLKATSVINPASTASLQKLTMGLSSTSTGTIHRSTGVRSSAGTSEADESAEEANELMKHTYVSQMKVRRLSRNAKDLETRLKVEKLMRRVEEKPCRSQKNAPSHNQDEQIPGADLYGSQTSAETKEKVRKYGCRDSQAASHPHTDRFDQK